MNYEYWDELSAGCDEFHAYAWDHLSDFRKELEQKQCRKVISSYTHGLGLASPSRMTRHIIRKYKTGRAIKSIKPGQLYEIIYYDSDDRPLAIEKYSDMSSEIAGRSETDYFVDYGGCIWTACFSEKHGWLYNHHYKIVYDDEQRLIGFYQINAGRSLQVYAEEYDYSEADRGIVTCVFTDYTGKAVGTSQDIPIGFKGSPAIQWKYVITTDEKGKYTALTSYKNIGGEFVFNEHADL